MSQAMTCVPLRRLLLLRSWTVREPRRLQKMRRMRGRKRDVLWTRSARIRMTAGVGNAIIARSLGVSYCILAFTCSTD